MKISLVVPLKDEENSVGRLLRSIDAQTRRPDECIFVDAGSADATVSFLKDAEEGRHNRLIILAESAYPGKARNIGVEKASGDIIAFTDGGIELDKDWLKNLAEEMEIASADVVYGHYAPRADTIFKECLALVMMQPQVMVDGKWMRKRSIASSLMRRSVWQAVGGFPDERAGEDRAFMMKIDEANFKVRYCPSAIITWDIPKDFKDVWNRFSTYSFHNANAGRIWNWHVPVLVMYMGAIVLIGLGIFVSPIFYAVLVGGLLIRIAKKIFGNRRESYLRATHMPAYLGLGLLLMIFIDAATFAGWFKSCKSRIISRKTIIS
ncbi:MAG: glycosyltransferase [Candidatus Omnitrophica bacterium]|nr:glycosyltransferase [Candidatus Omnitrophota bacterium]MCM8790643.1 glycosyltransferase [Candidatus Omnitrophota bacterium]